MIKKLLLLMLLSPVAAMAQTESVEEDRHVDHRGVDPKADVVRADETVFAIDEDELREIETALEANAVELIELERELGPDVRRIVRKAVIAAGRPLLGISIGPAGGKTGKVAGVGVVGVTPGGPADDAGIVTGDVIVNFGAVDLASASPDEAQEKLLEALHETEPGKAVSLTVSRDNKPVTIAVTPRITRGRYLKMPFEAMATRVKPGPDADFRFFHSPDVDFMLSDAQRQWEGIELVELTPDLGRYFGTEKGLLVIRRPADASVPLEEGDVIRSIGGREPNSVSQAMRILRSYDAGETLQLDLLRDKRRRKVDVDIPERR